MNESDVQEFWNSHPCGDHIGLHDAFTDDYERFFTAYDGWRYRQEAHIPSCPVSYTHLTLPTIYSV